MGKSKGPRIGRTKSPRSLPKQEAKAVAPRTEATAPLSWSGWGWVRISWAAWKFCWALGGPVSAAFALAPKISLAPSVNVDPSQTFGMQFSATNSGSLPAWNVRFSCALPGPAVSIGVLAPGNISPVPTLPGGATVTRNCFSESRDILGTDLVVKARYEWPLLPRQWETTVRFTAVKTASGYVIVPDYKNE